MAEAKKAVKEVEVKKELNKWGKQFEGEKLVPLEIPVDELNPTNAEWMCINGKEIWLAKGVELNVPKSIYDNYKHAKRGTAKAKRLMSKFTEIKN